MIRSDWAMYGPFSVGLLVDKVLATYPKASTGEESRAVLYHLFGGGHLLADAMTMTVQIHALYLIHSMNVAMKAAMYKIAKTPAVGVDGLYSYSGRFAVALLSTMMGRGGRVTFRRGSVLSGWSRKRTAL